VTLVPQTLDEINYWDLDMFEHGDPHEAWRIQREQAPVWWHDRDGGEPFWSVARFDDALAVLSDPLLFSSQRDGIIVRTDAALESGPPGAGLGIQPMIHTDPPRHAPLRSIISHNFRPRSIAQLEDQIRAAAVECLERAADERDVDFVIDIAHQVPAAITFALMGVPEDMWSRLADLQHQTVTATDPEFTHGRSPQEAAAAASLELHTYFAQIIQERMEEPGDDLLSQFLQGRVDGEELSWMQVVAEAGLLLAGGLDTTRAAASAGGILPLIQNPDQLKLLQDDPSLIAGATDEFVRWASPITSEARTATRDCELAGQKISEGDRVVVWSPSSNRDEAHFEDPFRFDVLRHPRHLGFAFGEHYCLGVHLARLTLKVEFEELLSRFSGFELTGEPARVRSNFVNGLKHLPVRLTPK